MELPKRGGSLTARLFVQPAQFNILAVSGSEKKQISGARVIILQGEFAGREGVCLGETQEGGLWAVSPDGTDAVVPLAFERDFGLLIDLSANPSDN